MIAEIARDLRLLHRLSGAAGEPGDHDRPLARPISGAAHGEFQHRCKQPGLADGELGGMDADGQPARAGIEVVAGEGALTARVELAIGIERERMRRDHRAPAQRGEHLRGPVLPAQSHERPQVTSRLHCAQSGRAVNVNARERRRQGRISTTGMPQARIAFRMNSTLCRLRLRHAAALLRSRPKMVDSVRLFER